MANLSSPGIGSGLDVKSIVSQLMVIERIPIDKLDAQNTKYQQKLSAIGKIKGALSALQTAAKTFSKGLSMKATSGDTSIFTATATSVATAGNYSVEIKHIADYNKVVSVNGYASSATLAAGSLTINLGEFDDDIDNDGVAAAASARDGTNWSFASASSATVNFTGGTLAQLRDAINTQAGGLVKAQIVSGADGDHLAITSLDKGRTNALQMTGTGDLAAFNYDIRSGSTATMREASISWSTEALIDGVPVRSNTNAITGAISGVTINALKTGTAATSLSVSKDMESITTQVQQFIKDYNSVVSTIKLSTNYDAGTKTASALTGDSAVRAVETQLRGALNSVPAGLSGSFTRLSDIGISIDRNGQMQLDTDKLAKAIDTSQADVSALLSAYGTQIDNTIKTQLDSASGVLSIRSKGIDSLMKDIATRKEFLESRMVTIEARYNKQFQALDSMMANMQKTSSYLAQQLSGLS